MRRTLLIALGLGAVIALGTWAVLQLTTDIEVLTWLGVAGVVVGLVAGGIVFIKRPALRAGMVAGALIGGGAAAAISYQTFFAIDDQAFVETKADSEASQKALDEAFGDEGGDDDFD